MQLTNLLTTIDRCRQIKGSDVVLSSITADSRAVTPGALFVAMPGTAQDGRRYIPQAMAQGAAALLVPDDTDLTSLPDCPVLTAHDMRLALSQAASTFYPNQSETIVAITGTSGKTSTAQFVRELWQRRGYHAASVGTLGVVTSEGTHYGSLTTPDPVTLHQNLHLLARDGVTHVALEASSIGIELKRLEQVHLKAAAFLNLSHEHLDFHQTMESYGAAKKRLFTDILPRGFPAVVHRDVPYARDIIEACNETSHPIIDFGTTAKTVRLISVSPVSLGQALSFEAFGKNYSIILPLIGSFQAMNAMAALSLAVATGLSVDHAVEGLTHLTPVPGRLQLIGQTASRGSVFVDYAHKPDALENVLEGLRPHVAAHPGAKLGVVFGCGGNRDTTKRPLMGEIAVNKADWVIVTDDNPRREDPALIRRAVIEGCGDNTNWREMGDRAMAIREAMDALGPHDILVIAGKGHETGQIIGDIVHPFDDAAIARAYLEKKRMTSLWQADAVLRAVRGETLHEQNWEVTGIAIDSRAVKPGDLFVALKGPTHDAHAFVGDAFARGATAALVEKRPLSLPPSCCLVQVSDTFTALQALGNAGRARAQGTIIAVTGSVGKTTAKEMLRLILRSEGSVYANEGSFNNHWGVPLSLARLPAESKWGVFEMGMNHPGELAVLTQQTKPQVCMITNVEAVHLENFSSMDAIADAKAEIFQGMNKDGFAVLNGDNPFCARLMASAKKNGVGTCWRFGEAKGLEARLTSYTPTPDGSEVEAEILGQSLRFSIATPGHHVAIDAVGALLTAAAAGADIARVADQFAAFRPLARRGAQQTVSLATGGNFDLVDETFNASPVAVRAAIGVMDSHPTRGKGRRIAVLGDMKELGETAPALHASLANVLQIAKIDLVYTCGPLMRHLFEALPSSMRGFHADTSEALAPVVASAVGEDDHVLVKGSKSVHMEVVVQALEALSSLMKQPRAS